LSESTKDSDAQRRSSKSLRTPKPSTSTNAAPADGHVRAVQGKTLPYKTIGSGGVCPAILLSFVTLAGETLPPTPAIIDSGADRSVFPSEWARRIGINLDEDCQTITTETAGGPSENFVYEPGVFVIVEEAKYRVQGATFSKTLPVVLLGRKDFFTRYKVTFDERAKTFTLEPYGPGSRLS
jgi:hypothetical protein